ncbi:MAG: hypothetical protein IJS04_07030 [Muribaculaceae bacterium]|nr:hypothetical protein [Muribaculaceae bacterium]
MKSNRLLLILMLLILPITMFAQSKHLTFKGIPIDGTLKEFSKKLVQNGFMEIETTTDFAEFEGTFAGHSNCTVIAYSSPNGQLVHSVAVIFPQLDSWSLLEGQYRGIKESLIKKYGAPVIETESFQTEYEPKDDYSKLHELKMDRCNYKTSFQTDEGAIMLQIFHQSYYCYVLLGYADNINMTIAQNAADNDF